MQSNCEIKADGLSLSLSRCEACSPYRILFDTENTDERETPASATLETSGLARDSFDGIRQAQYFAKGAIQARQKPAVDAVPDASALLAGCSGCWGWRVSAFVFWMVVLMAIDVCLKIAVIATGQGLDRTRATVAIDTIVTAAFVVWGSVVYFTGAA